RRPTAASRNLTGSAARCSTSPSRSRAAAPPEISQGETKVFDFAVAGPIQELARKVADFVDTRVIPYERDRRLGPHGPSEDLRLELVALAREAGLLSPHVSREWGGLGLSHAERAVIFEAAGRSTLGPVALNCNAPDEGNMHLLEQVASQAQKERWLRPLAAGEIRSCFAMPE